MTRIFPILALFAFVLNVVTLLLGFRIDPHVDPSQTTVHFLFGLLSAMAVMLVEGIVATYFIGTTRWCKEVVETYSLDRSLIARSTALKRRAFPWAVLSMLAMVAIAALGASADPQNTLVRNTADWASWHMIAALTGVALLAATFYLQWNYLHVQLAVIQEVLGDVERIRRERGLE